MNDQAKHLQKGVANSRDDYVPARSTYLPLESRTPCTTKSTPTRNDSNFKLSLSGEMYNQDEKDRFDFHTYPSTKTPVYASNLPNLYSGSSTSGIEDLRGSARILYLDEGDEETQGRSTDFDDFSISSFEKHPSEWSETSKSWTVSSTKSSRTFDQIKTSHDSTHHCDSSLSSDESNKIPGYEYRRNLSTLKRETKQNLPDNIGRPVQFVAARLLKGCPGESNFSMLDLSSQWTHFSLFSMHQKVMLALKGSRCRKRVAIKKLLLIILLYSTTTFLLLFHQIHTIPSADLKESFRRQSMKGGISASITDEKKVLEQHEQHHKLADFSEIQITRSLGGIHSIRDANRDMAITKMTKRQTLGFGKLDTAMYEESRTGQDVRPRRVVNLNECNPSTRSEGRVVEVDRTPFSDNTQLYSSHDSDDEQLSKMERVRPEVFGDECISDSWQREHHSSCNNVHEFDLLHVDDTHSGGHLKLFKKEGYWRNAWKIEMPSNESRNTRETYILKTPKYIHNFEQAYYETDRIDALAMSMLTFSPFVVDIYSYCGRTVITEFAGGPSLGSIFDKARKHDLKRLQIARDLALGLSHVHYGKEGNEDNAIFTHFDINPANVVVTNKRALRINDFNIAQMMKRNVTSGKQCNLPHHHFPNPQWRSPEEVNEFDHLSAKVDVFSLGHIFYRIICGHEPWNRLEQGRKPSSDVLARKVKAGILPRVPQNVMESTDPVVVAIRKAMFMCYTVDPMNRPSSKYVAAFLDEELKNLKLNRT